MAIGTTERPVNFSPRMSCPTWPDGRCRKTAGGGDHVDRRCAWGAKRNRAYLPRLPALTRRALPDFAEPSLSRIRIAGNKAVAVADECGRPTAATPAKNPRHRARRETTLQREIAVKNASLGIFDPSLGIFDRARCRRNPDFLGGFPPKPRSVLRNRQGIPRLSRVSSRAHEGKTRGGDEDLSR